MSNEALSAQLDNAQLDKLYSDRQQLLGKLRKQQNDLRSHQQDLNASLDSYDQTSCEVEALTMALLPLVPKELQVELKECAQKLGELRTNHTQSHNAVEQLCSILGALISCVMELEEKQFQFLHQQLRKMIVLAGCRDHVADFREEVYYDMCDQEPDLATRCFTLELLLSAMGQEYRDYRNRRIAARPLNTAFYRSVQRLGLTSDQWLELKVLNSTSIASFHSKFSVDQLSKEVFPPELEGCRPVLVQAANIIKRRREQRHQQQREAPEDGFDFF